MCLRGECRKLTADIMNEWLLNNLLAFGLAFALTGMLIPQILVIAFRKNLFDGHDPRKVHKGDVPRLGGIAFVPAIIFSVLAVVGFGLNVYNATMSEALANTIVPLLFFICSLMLLFLVGIADDMIGVRYGAKFMFQILASVLIIGSGVWMSDFYGLLGLRDVPAWIGWPMTILAVVYVVNAINLIDGIDGLAAGLAALALCFYGSVFYFGGAYIYSLVAWSGFGSLLTFLYYNVFGSASRRKKIFMGDTGSLTIGMLLAFMALLLISDPMDLERSTEISPMVIAVSPLLVPLLDVVRVFFRRLRKRKNPFMPDRSHIHHKLLALGMTPAAALTVILSFALLLLALNVWLSRLINVNILILTDIAIWTVGNMALTKAIRRRERQEGTSLY